MPQTERETPRKVLSKGIGALDIPPAKAYADFIRVGDPGGPIPCWGGAAERFERDFIRDSDRKALWPVLVRSQDPRPIMLFIHFNRRRPAVLREIIGDAGLLPVFLQRFIVSLDEAAELVPDRLDAFAPSAQQLWEAEPATRKREREMFTERVVRLLSFRFFVPNQQEPANEGARPVPNE